jgi:Leucine-rich repeat (LRR) protein
LSFDQNRIEDEGAIAIAESSHLPHLIGLSISDNRITTQGAMAILNSVYRAHLTSLDVSFNSIEDEFGLAILQNRRNIQELNVDSTQITLDIRRALGTTGDHAEYGPSHASLNASFSEGEGDPF